MDRLQPIPETELLAIDEDVDSSSQAKLDTNVCSKSKELVSRWCHGELRKALCTLMRLDDAALLADAPSHSSMNLQAIAQGLQGGRYVNTDGSTNAGLLWSDIDNFLGGIERALVDQVDVERLCMVTKMWALVKQLELDFWDSLSKLEQCPDEDALCSFVMEQCPPDEEGLFSLVGEGFDDVGSWVLEASTGLGEWLFGSTLMTEMCVGDIYNDLWLSYRTHVEN